jgi:hypothetical protein
LRVNGIGTKTPSLGATLGTRFNQTEVRLIPPNTMAFIGQAIVGYSVPSPLGDVSVRGQPGFELRVTVTPRPGAGDSTEVVDEESWFSRHAQALAIIGAVSLAVAVAVVAITAAPATGGASLALLALESVAAYCSASVSLRYREWPRSYVEVAVTLARGYTRPFR